MTRSVENIIIPEVQDNSKLKYKEIEANKLSVSQKEIRPINCGTVIYFGGTFETPSSLSTENLRQSLADYSGSKAYAFPSDANPQEVLNFVKTNNLKDVVLVGYSQGAMRAVELAKLLQNENSNKVSGLVLLEPTSLFEQKHLSIKFISQVPSSFKEILKYNNVKKNLSSEVSKNKYGKILRQILKEGFVDGIPITLGTHKDGRPKLKNQIVNMRKVHPDLKEIEAPIIIIQGKNDKVSDYKKSDPKEIFKASEKIYKIVPSNLGTHFLPMFRSEQVAKVSLSLINRCYR